MVDNRNKALQFLANQFLKNGQTPAVKAACAEAIGMIGGENALNFLTTQFLKNGQTSEIKIACAKAIGVAGAQED